MWDGISDPFHGLALTDGDVIQYNPSAVLSVVAHICEKIFCMS